jgi:hypothetical protein
MPKSWQQKYASAKPAHVVTLDKPFAGVPAAARLLVPDPALVERHVRAVPRGETMDMAAVRARMAEEEGADAACPVTTSIHLRIVAELAVEATEAGMPVQEVAPFWRVVAPEAVLAKKLSCGSEFIRRRRACETPEER